MAKSSQGKLLKMCKELPLNIIVLLFILIGNCQRYSNVVNSKPKQPLQ